MSEKLPILDCGNLSKYMRDSCGLEKKRLYRRFNDWNVNDTNKSGKTIQTVNNSIKKFHSTQVFHFAGFLAVVIVLPFV